MYLALYRKYRPRTFEDVISQPHITTTLKNEIIDQKTSHAYLFTGSRGTGKTTCSKILAKAVNCLNPQNGNPCLECEVCRGIEDGSILDVVEMDAASNSRVDDVRFLREEALYTPSVCKYRVYIIDEVHMLSINAFNALLKIMEEPPAHVIFILATTETHKVPITILSRCQRFDFKRIKTEDIADRLLSVADQEGISLEPQAAQMIAKLADGGMRDALSLLDQCVAYGNDITPNAVVSAAGVSKKDQMFALAQAVRGKDASAALQLLQQLYDASCDFSRVCEELIHFYRDLMVVKAAKEPSDLVAVLPGEVEQLQQTAAQTPMSQIVHCLTVFTDTLDRLSRQSNKKTEMEMAFVKLCTPALDQSIDALVRRLDALEHAVKVGAVSQGAQSTEAQAPVASAQPSVQDNKEAQVPVAHQAPKNTSKSPTALDPSKFVPVAYWSEILEDLARIDRALWSILNGSQAYEYENLMLIDSPNPMFAALIKQEGNAAKLSEAVVNQTGKKYRFSLRGGAMSRPAEQTDPLDDVLKKAGQAGIEVKITNDAGR